MSEAGRTGPMLSALLIAALFIGIASALRVGLVEPPAMSTACDVDPWRSGACLLRWLTIQAFVDARLGVFALAAALLATLTRRRWIAAVALAAGGAGLMLYSAGLAAPAALLAALVFVRTR